ncbi:MAG: glutathione S-transferase [Cycloclasticus sp.]|nr:glutathione S-transferase [Cycloclasticus sp.]MBQ0790584.1 glutathione S-transferase [Cycloclasticus sp.]
MSDTPILYSFRRCPYAMRARLAIRYSGVKVQLREVVLRHKPAAMLAISPKATVPVLLLPDGRVLEESWDIVHWATAVNDPDAIRGDAALVSLANALVEKNDTDFKQHLDHYKYADRFPEFSAEHYRSQAEGFLAQLEEKLSQHQFLLTDTISLADLGIFPFVRQFAHVDIDWFRQSPYPNVIQWMDFFLDSERFNSVMKKYPAWAEGQAPLLF